MKQQNYYSQLCNDADSSIDEMIASIENIRNNELTSLKNKIKETEAQSIENRYKNPVKALRKKRDALRQRIKALTIIEFEILELINKLISMEYKLAGPLGTLSLVVNIDKYATDANQLHRADEIYRRYMEELKNGHIQYTMTSLEKIRNLVKELIDGDVQHVREIEEGLAGIPEEE